MNYWDDKEEFEKRGIDYDLGACLEYNPQPEVTVENIEKVLATHPGEHDGDDYRWVVSLKDGKFAFIQGGCDYTGWDCQSWATSKIVDTPENAALCALGEDVPITSKSPFDAGLGHMISLLSGNYAENFKVVYLSLLKQLTEGKDATWRDNVDMPDLPKI